MGKTPNNMNIIRLFILSACLAFLCIGNIDAQQRLTKDQIMAMSIEELSDLPLEELMEAVETLGVTSVDELFSLIMNKSVSSASKKEEGTFVSPLSSSVLTKEEMRMYGATTVEEALKLVPGIIVQQKSNGVYDIQLRGLANVPDNNMLCYAESNNTLLMIDGRSAINFATGSVYLDRLPVSIEDIERIEVVRGASSALYGANAVQGVINIITEKPNADSKKVQGSMQLGTSGTAIGDVAFRTSLSDKLSLGITANMQMRDRDDEKYYIFSKGDVGLPDDYGSVFTYDVVDVDGQSQVVGWKLSNPIEEGYYSINDMMQMYTISSTSPYPILLPVSDKGADFKWRFSRPKQARKNYGANGYISFSPAANVHLNLTGGWFYDNSLHQSLTDHFYASGYQQSKSSYANLSANIHNLSLRMSYTNESNSYSYGEPEYSMLGNQVQFMAGYDFTFGGLSVRPGFDFIWTRYEDVDSEYLRNRGNGFLNSSATLRAVTPSIKLDYSNNGFRAIAAVRSDKTNMPDKWNTSWLGSLSYEFNKHNFLRLSYSRGMRSAIFLNSSCSYAWNRNMMPDQISFLGNPDEDLMKIDNFELGYRLRASSSFIIDFEAFYSHSDDYGELMSAKSSASLNAAPFRQDPSKLMGLNADNILSAIIPYTQTSAIVQYGALPFDVYQTGASVAVDWAVAKSLMMKANLNYQQTKIDGYFAYDQGSAINEQLSESITRLATSFGAIAQAFATDMSNQMQGKEEPSVLVPTVQQLLAQGVLNGADMDNFVISTESSNYTIPTLEDNHKHKTTPSFYGSLGLLYRPMSAINVASTLNFLGKREYTTIYGVDKLSPRFTVDMKVGYRPTEGIEFFLNARNLFNNHKREMCYMDRVGGVYTVGLNVSL